jgi:hypothetical protein
MPRFEPDASEVRATTRIFDRGEYELAVGDPYGFAYTREKDGKDIGGVRYALKMVGKVDSKGKLNGEFEGEPVTPIRFYVHSAGAISMLKRFAMATLGYAQNPASEEKFDKEVWKDVDLSVEGEGDEVSIGSFFETLTGQRVRITLDKRIWEDQPQQDHRNPVPITG